MQAERVWSLNGIRREVPFLLNLVLYVSLTTSMVQKYNQRCRNRDNGQTMFASPHFFRQNLIKKLIFSKSITVLKTCTPSHSLLHSKNSELWYKKLVSILILIVDDEVQKKMYNLLWSARLVYFYQIYSTKFYSRKLDISPFSFQFPLECYVKQ